MVTPLLFFSYCIERAITRLRSGLEDLRPQTSWRFGHAITTELTAPSHRLQQRGSGNRVDQPFGCSASVLFVATQRCSACSHHVQPAPQGRDVANCWWKGLSHVGCSIGLVDPIGDVLLGDEVFKFDIPQALHDSMAFGNSSTRQQGSHQDSEPCCPAIQCRRTSSLA